MSADNGIYILPMNIGDGDEIRVTYTSAIDNIYYNEDDPVLQYGDVLEVFGNAKSFTDMGLAVLYALEQNKEVGGTEYGVVVLQHYNYPPLPKAVG